MRRSGQKETLFVIIMLMTVVCITGFELRLLRTQQLIQNMITKEIDYEKFRNMQLEVDLLDKAEVKAAHAANKNPKLQSLPYMNEIGYLTFCMLADDNPKSGVELISESVYCRGIRRVSESACFQEMYGYLRAILSDLEYFPVPKVTDGSADISYTNSWYQPRTYGGDRKHEGTDLMASNNQRGYFPVISITDGIVEKMGWLEQGGYRIGIRSESGGYFYYAHLDSYAPEIEQGDQVIAGQLLGFMGDSGYGSEGTTGQFDVHLHVGIYVNTESGEMSVNPYWILKILEKNRTYYINNNAGQ